MSSFDWKFYLNRYPDLRRAGINNKKKALLHYLKLGKLENRFPNKNMESTYTNNVYNLSDKQNPQNDIKQEIDYLKKEINYIKKRQLQIINILSEIKDNKIPLNLEQNDENQMFEDLENRVNSIDDDNKVVSSDDYVNNFQEDNIIEYTNSADYNNQVVSSDEILEQDCLDNVFNNKKIPVNLDNNLNNNVNDNLNNDVDDDVDDDLDDVLNNSNFLIGDIRKSNKLSDSIEKKLKMEKKNKEEEE